ncbi:phosphatidate cytidylyltransferase [Isachenkonia alkalipeptolytica]|uniref:Phosphatidate cytidylyltransferase n=1 Tax=Isachenkonia alkalipeptolytica TaxID=2565777 RepID=A0AA43XIW1_9CLOT|nr:phosphatidate cytidylyltransferase [Isachenkonia alkalipeptolytica]NBG87603.1 phosphatidate cytidylyltransferase [Isachenkonia alkalipeptolytica]
MITRIISAVIGIPILIGIITLGGAPLMAALGLVMILGLREFYQALSKKGFQPVDGIGYAFTVFLVFSLFLGQDWATQGIYGAFLLTALTLLLNEKYTVQDGMLTLYGILYIPILMSYIIRVDLLESPAHIIWLVFIIAFATDTFAYFTGRFLGKHKLCPRVSPKKTIEGSIGGLVGTVAACGVFAYFIFPQGIFSFMILGALGSAVAQMGDLSASMVKRWTGIKDFGKIMPGHGGVLDRFDSIIFAAPLVYYYITMVVG